MYLIKYWKWGCKKYILIVVLFVIVHLSFTQREKQKMRMKCREKMHKREEITWNWRKYIVRFVINSV
jgi:hypothetical protein